MQNVILILDVVIPSRRRFWALDYEQTWFESMWNNKQHSIFSEFWYKEFRMRPDTFEYIVGLVSPNISKEDSNSRKTSGSAIWRLSTGNSYRTASKVFGIAKSIVIKVTNEFVQAMLQFTEHFIQFPQTEMETRIAIEKFITASCWSNRCNTRRNFSPLKRKVQKYTEVNQCVVGANLIFLDFVSGFRKHSR